MPLPTGQISMSQVNTELGIASTTTISLNQTNVRTLAGVPSGTISMSNLQGKSNQFAFSFAGGTNVNLRTAAINAGWDQTSKVIATNTGTIQSSSTGSYALTINGSFPGGVEFINNSLIVGRGGNGGQGAIAVYVSGGSNGAPGAAAGPALLVSVPVTVTNNGTIAGGGGGGGGGGGFNTTGRAPAQVAGGGGGGGIGVSLGGPGGTASGGVGQYPGSPGNPGTTTAAGAGAPQTNFGTSSNKGGAGGNGGGYGSAGSTGGNPVVQFWAVYYSPGAGGAAGAAIAGNSNITWTAFGNRFGNIS